MVKAATLESELFALMIFKDLIVVLRYKLRMVFIRLEIPAYIFYDNHGVTKIMSITESVLHKKKCN